MLHGDEFDGVVLYAKWLAFLGDHAYTLLLKLNRLVNGVRPLARPALLVAVGAHQEAGQERGPVHLRLRGRRSPTPRSSAAPTAWSAATSIRAEVRQIGEVTYYNDGDWVESCTALVEHADGRMEILDWAERKRAEARARSAKRRERSRPA